MADAGLLEVVETAERTIVDAGDHDLFAHYIGKLAMEKAVFDGVPAVALCGKEWLPTKDASRFPVCAQCLEAYNALPPGD